VIFTLLAREPDSWNHCSER